MTDASVARDDVARLPMIDAVRGFALLGIFLMNLGEFSGFGWLTRDEKALLPTAAVDLPIAFVILWLAQGKFYSLVSLLFGIGFALQMDAAVRHGDLTLRRFRRRLLVLFVFGSLHLMFYSDILTFYALMGFVLIAFRHLDNRALVRWAVALVAAPVLLDAAIYISGGWLDPGAPLFSLGEQTKAAMGFAGKIPVDVVPTAGWADYMRFAVAGPFYRYADLLTTGRPFKVLAMFLLGLAVGRSSLLRDPTDWTPMLRRVRRVGFAVGLPAAFAQAAIVLTGLQRDWRDSPLKIAEAAVYGLAVAPLALAYAASLVLLWQRGAWRARLEHLVPAGRMALTNYLAQTAVAVLVFYGVGLGLMGKVGPLLWTAFGLVFFTLQVAASRWWLRRFQFGPMEWLWRQATYGRRLPLRRAAGPEAPAVASM